MARDELNSTEGETKRAVVQPCEQEEPKVEKMLVTSGRAGERESEVGTRRSGTGAAEPARKRRKAVLFPFPARGASRKKRVKINKKYKQTAQQAGAFQCLLRCADAGEQRQREVGSARRSCRAKHRREGPFGDEGSENMSPLLRGALKNMPEHDLKSARGGGGKGGKLCASEPHATT